MQAAIDAVDIINKQGVVMDDCDPRNAMMYQELQTPLIVDLAQYCFKNGIIKIWEEEGLAKDNGWNEGWDWDPEVKWWDFCWRTDNCGAIGAVMATRLRQQSNMHFVMRLPDYDQMIRDIQQRKAGGGGVASAQTATPNEVRHTKIE